MTFVVTESCIQCKYTDCVEVCPMSCFMEGPNFLVIHPDECIDCSICVAECPVQAIVADKDVPAEQLDFVRLNREIALRGDWPRIAHKKPPLPGHEQAAGLPHKRRLLQGAPGWQAEPQGANP